jgi:hypothetical protein
VAMMPCSAGVRAYVEVEFDLEGVPGDQLAQPCLAEPPARSQAAALDRRHQLVIADPCSTG